MRVIQLRLPLCVKQLLNTMINRRRKQRKRRQNVVQTFASRRSHRSHTLTQRHKCKRKHRESSRLLLFTEIESYNKKAAQRFHEFNATQSKHGATIQRRQVKMFVLSTNNNVCDWQRWTCKRCFSFVFHRLKTEIVCMFVASWTTKRK